jgi:hypothetical protein
MKVANRVFLSAILSLSIANSSDISRYGEFTLASNLLDRGESLTNDNATGSGTIGFEYGNIGVEFSSFGVTNGIEFDTSLAINNSLGILNYSFGVLNISTSNPQKDSDFETQTGAEGSISVELPLEYFSVGADLITDIKYSDFTTFAPKFSTNLNGLDLEFIYGFMDMKDSSDFNYYHILLSTPCRIGNGSWNIEIAKKESEDMVYAFSHTINF